MEGLLCGMSSDLLCMDRGDLRHNWCMGLLADYIRNIERGQAGCKGREVQALYLSPGFGDCNGRCSRASVGIS